MLSWIRRHVTVANIAMTLALVFAMSGGAYAAKHYLITSTKQISPKVLKQLKGARGPVGPEGKQGSTGPPGLAGAVGAKGEAGAAGKDGVSVTAAKLKEGDKNCPAGGSELKAANGTTYACNGSPWVAGGLPKGASEMGEWNLIRHAFGVERLAEGISFGVPLAEPLKPEDVHFIGPEEGAGEPNAKLPEGCSGNYEAPEAASGHLCVFAAPAWLNVQVPSPAVFGLQKIEGQGETVGADRGGAQLLLFATKEGQAFAYGSWVVTG